MKPTIIAATVLAVLASALASMVAGRASAAPVDVTPPTCGAVNVTGPPEQALITVSDAGGLATVVVTVSTNADTPVPPFISGTTFPLTITATKIDQTKSSTVELRLTDTSGNTIVCRVVFGAQGAPFIVDSAVPTCGVTATAPGHPPAQATFTLQDVGSGIASVVVTVSDNADTPVPPFTVGTTTPIVVTATKIDQSQSSTVTIVTTDVAGLSSTCTATFLPLAVTAARVRRVSATATSRGVSVHWRTASELGLAGFNVYRSVGAKRRRVNAHLIVARGGAHGHAYTYLARGSARSARYWVQAVYADGTRTWFGPARARG